MRLLPRSLFGRLSLVLLTGLVAAQSLSAYILLRDRGEALYQSIRGDLVQRSAGIVRLLDALPPDERRRLLPLFNTAESRIRLSRKALELPPADTESSITVKAIERALNDLLPEAGAIQVALLGETDNLPLPPGGPPGRHGRHMGPGRMGGPWSYLHGVNAQARGFYIQVELSDGHWVLFDRRIPEDLFDQPTRLLLTLAILLASVVLLSLLAVRWVVRPLHRLRLAAEELGRDIHRPPLPETGPLEVAQTARAFNTMQQRIRNYIDDKARILAAVSHDLKTPLTRLRLRSDLLDDEETREKLQADLNDMEAMVSATLDFMRGTESREQSRQVDLTALLETIRDDALAAGWEVSLTGKVNKPVVARPVTLKRCIANLVENAARYGESADIQVSEHDGNIRIQINDAGPGIPEELLEKVFDPFYRLESSRARHTGGTGLGLGIARNIARAHGGDLVLKNREQGGLTAELTLPR